ncbi:hypothetical protein [Candidatus Nitrosopumilus sediminis]|uniref:hypothetical protein n=1 Tax=Candidatus Nitrosopumilus sediminis TaxID=1229909 RepID=UPI0018731D64|nr:hypothetical protein [Candidatus Nitrosopumilus sediminis]
MNSKSLILIGIAIVITIGVVAISTGIDIEIFENNDNSEQVEESSPRVFKRSLNESVGISGP